MYKINITFISLLEGTRSGSGLPTATVQQDRTQFTFKSHIGEQQQPDGSPMKDG